MKLPTWALLTFLCLTNPFLASRASACGDVFADPYCHWVKNASPAFCPAAGVPFDAEGFRSRVVRDGFKVLSAKTSDSFCYNVVCPDSDIEPFPIAEAEFERLYSVDRVVNGRHCASRPGRP